MSPRLTPAGPGQARADPAGEEDTARADPGRWLTLTELAAQTGRRREGVRSWVKRAARAGRVSTRTTNRGELQVWATVGLLAGLDPGPARAGRGGDPVTGRAADPGRDEEAAGPQALVRFYERPGFEPAPQGDPASGRRLRKGRRRSLQ